MDLRLPLCFNIINESDLPLSFEGTHHMEEYCEVTHERYVLCLPLYIFGIFILVGVLLRYYASGSNSNN